MAEEAPPVASSAALPTSAPAQPAGGRHAVWLVLVLVVIGLALAVLIYKHQQRPPVKAPPPVTVSTTNAARGDIDVIVPGLGTVTPVYTAWISPRVDGQIKKVNYTEGQMVTTNDLLVEIDPAPYQAQLDQTEGQLARDHAQLEGARIDLDRFQAAYVKKAIPKQQVDDQLALVHQFQGAVKLDEGQMANAKVQLAYCFIHAPFAGRVGLRLADPGNVVHAANTNALVVITQLQPITAIFSVDERFLPAIQRQLQAGHQMKVEAWNPDMTQKLATGNFLTMDNMIDVATRTIRIKALFDNKDLMLFPNEFVNPKLIVETLHGVTLVPTSAIQRNPKGAFVYEVTNREATVTNQSGTAQTNVTEVGMRAITPGVVEAETTAVQGLEPGTTIVTDNFNKLGDGMRVNLRQAGGAGQKGGAPAKKKHAENTGQAPESAS